MSKDETINEIIEYIDREIADIQDCPQETCPLSNLDQGKIRALKDLKKYLEEWYD